MNLDEVLQLQVLKLKALQTGYGNSRLVEHAIDQAETGAELRQMCAKVSKEMYERLDTICGLLDMSKRQFIEIAVAEALEKAEQLIQRTGALGQGEL